MEDNSAYTVGRVISKRMLPVVILYFLYGVWESLDTILVANFVDSTGMTIVVMCSPLTFFLAVLYDTYGYGSTSLFTQDQGRNDKENAALAVNTGFTFVLLWAVVIIFFGMVFRITAARLIGIPAHLLQIADSYLLWIFPGFGLYLIGRFLDYVVGIDNDPRLCNIAKVAHIVVCTALAILFMGYYKMGLVGFAIAFVISNTLWVGILGFHFSSDKATFCLHPVLPSWGLTRKIHSYMGIGLSEDIAFSLTLVTMNHLIQNFPVPITTFYFILLEIYVVMEFVAHGLSQVVAPLAGVYHGEGNGKAVGICYRNLLKNGLIASGVCVLVLCILMPWIPKIYNYNYTDMFSECRRALFLYALSIPFYFWMVCVAKMATYTGKVKVAIWLQIGNDLIILLPILIMAALYRNTNLLWSSFAIASFLTVAIFSIYKWRWERTHGCAFFSPEASDDAKTKSLYFLIKDSQELMDYQAVTELFLSKQQIPQPIQKKVEHALEEVFSYANESGLKKTRYIDLQLIACNQESVRLIARIENNTHPIEEILSNKKISVQNFDFLNLRLLRALSRKFTYNRVLDLDVLDVVF